MKKLLAVALISLFAAAVLMPTGTALAECDKTKPSPSTVDGPAPKTTKA